VLQEECTVLSSHSCKERKQTRYNLVCTDKDRPADEDGGDHIPVFLRNVVEKIEAVTKGCVGAIFKTVPMNIKGSAGGSQLVKIVGNLTALPTGLGEEDGDGDRSGGRARHYSGGFRSTAKGKEDEAEHCNKHNTDPSHGRPSPVKPSGSPTGCPHTGPPMGTEPSTAYP